MDDLEVPEEYLCPISQMLMADPVCAHDGHTYDRALIFDWLRPGRMTSPLTNLLLATTQLTPNFTLKAAIQRWWCGQSELRKTLRD